MNEFDVSQKHFNPISYYVYQLFAVDQISGKYCNLMMYIVSKKVIPLITIRGPSDHFTLS